MRIIADQLGLSRDRYTDFKRWSDASVNIADPSRGPEEKLNDARAAIEMRSFFVEEVNRARENPSDNLLSAFANTTNDDGQTLSPNDLSMLLQVVLAAGNETTTHALGSAVLRLAQDQELQALLRQQPDLIPAFIEEVLRLDAPLQGLFRRATQDTRIGNVAVPAGAMVNVRFGAGNRDPKQYSCPADLDLNRGRSNHLAFGFGIHHCIGSQLARSELRLAMEKLLEGSQAINLEDGPDAVGRKPHFLAYGPRRLMVKFDRT
jgi:cytochrome P450